MVYADRRFAPLCGKSGVSATQQLAGAPRLSFRGRALPDLASSRLAQLVERKTLNLVVVGSSPTVGGSTSLLLVGWPSGPRRWF